MRYEIGDPGARESSHCFYRRARRNIRASRPSYSHSRSNRLNWASKYIGLTALTQRCFISKKQY
jgi:hypothetical protein